MYLENIILDVTQENTVKFIHETTGSKLCIIEIKFNTINL